MNGLVERAKRLSTIMGFLLMFFVLGSILTSYKTIFLGLLLGACVSLMNSVYTALKVRQFGKRFEAGLKPRGFGMLTRFSLVGLAALIAIRNPELFNMPSFAAGLILAPVILVIDGLAGAHRFSQKLREGRRD